MDARAERQPSKSVGAIAAVLGLISVATVIFIGFSSFTAFHPGDWLAIAALVLFGVSWLAAVALGIVALRRAGRGWALVGLGCSLASAVAMFVMLTVAG